MLLSLCAASVVAVMHPTMLSPRGKGRANHGNLIVRQLVERNIDSRSILLNSHLNATC